MIRDFHHGLHIRLGARGMVVQRRFMRYRLLLVLWFGDNFLRHHRRRRSAPDALFKLLHDRQKVAGFKGLMITPSALTRLASSGLTSGSSLPTVSNTGVFSVSRDPRTFSQTSRPE